MTARRRAVFLDRDGVLTRQIVRDGKPYPPSRMEDLDLLPGVADAIARLKDAGFLLVCVTNQPDVARGTLGREVVDAMHERLGRWLPLDRIEVCCEDGDAAPRRKPNPGMLLDAAARLGIDLARSFMVGDRWRDVDAGKRAGCRSIFIDCGYNESLRLAPDAVVGNLAEAADWILAQPERRTDVNRLQQLKVKIFGDGATKADMLDLYKNPLIKGFTTNPTLMRKAGIANYEAFALDIVKAIPDRPLSFEVFSDDFAEMERQAMKIRAWGENVYVKIPITNTRRESSATLVRKLSSAGVKVNVTAMTTLDQVHTVAGALDPKTAAYVSVFAGRVADTGVNPVPMMAEAVRLLHPLPRAELIWASPRELLNIFQADAIGCQVITVTYDILKKLSLVGKDLDEYSLDTVKMFREDATKSGYTL